MANPIARVAAASAPVSAPAEDAPVSVFGDDGTMAHFYATMLLRDAKSYALCGPVIALVAGAADEISAIAAAIVAEDERDKDAAATARWCRESVVAEDGGANVHGILSRMANGVVSMAPVNTYGHGKVGHKVVSHVPATETRPAGRLVIVFTPDTLTDGTGTFANAYDAAPESLVMGPRPIRVKDAAEDAPAEDAAEDAAAE